MIEILFSDSASGSLKVAQKFGEGNYKGNFACSFFVSREDGSKPTQEEINLAQKDEEYKECKSWENATPMGGSSTDIFGFNLLLSVGDILENQSEINRQQVFLDLYSIFSKPEYIARLEILNRAKADLEIIHARMTKGETVRVWYSNHPDEMCGLHWFMYQIHEWNLLTNEIIAVKLPKWENHTEGIVLKSAWHEVLAEEWHRYLPLQKCLPIILKQNLVAKWQELKTENSALRALLNGQLVSMLEDLYDNFIIREIKEADMEFREILVIGNVIGKYSLGIEVAWVANRIEKMIQEDKLKVISPSNKDMPSYCRILKKMT